MCLLETIDGNEKIDIQMPEEIAKADWIPLEKMKHFTFTTMAKNLCQVLHNQAKINSGQIDLKQMPIGDLFRDSSFSYHDYELFKTP